MSANASSEPGPSEGPTAGPHHDFGEIHNMSELLYFLNHTLSECHVELDENTRRVVLFVLYLAIFVVGLVENLLVICVNWRHSGRTGLLNLYVFNMAVADLCIILSLPVWMLEVTVDYLWLWGSFFCRFTHYFYFANMYSSIFFLTCLTVDRYVTITSRSPLWQRHQHQIRRAVCAGVWFLAAILPLPEVVHIQLLEGSEPICIFMAPFETDSTWTQLIALSTTLSFLLPLPLIVVFNVLLACRLRRQGQSEGWRYSLLVCSYITVFVICWLPYHMTLLVLTIQEIHTLLPCSLAHFLYFFYDIIDCFAMLHCIANPILYNFLSPTFRSQLRNVVVHYLPKDQARAGAQASPSSSSTQHSIVITKEGSPPTTADARPLPSPNAQGSSGPEATQGNPTLLGFRKWKEGEVRDLPGEIRDGESELKV